MCICGHRDRLCNEYLIVLISHRSRQLEVLASVDVHGPSMVVWCVNAIFPAAEINIVMIAGCSFRGRNYLGCI